MDKTENFKFAENHQFNVGIAQKYGVEEAIIIQHFHFWLEKNEANGKNFHDGKYWTFNSAKAFSKIFPYWSAKSIARKLKNMEARGLIISGNYNEDARDRSKWYTLSESVQCIFHICPMDFPKVSNPVPKSDQPLPDSKPNINTDIVKERIEKENPAEDKSSDSNLTKTPYKKIADLYSTICTSYPKLAKLSDARKKVIHARFNDGYKFEDFKHLFEMAENSSFLKGQNNRRWHATFDWLIKESNMAKVIEGNYANDKNQISTNSGVSTGHTGEKKGWGGYLC